MILTRGLYHYGSMTGHLLYRDDDGQKMEVPVDFGNWQPDAI